MTTAYSQGSGYTPGFASRLQLCDHRRVFVKIADSDAPWMMDSYRDEVIKNRLLPSAVPAPRVSADLKASLEGRDWYAVVYDDIEGRPPHRPWTAEDAQAAIMAVERTADHLAPAPAGYDWLPVSTELGGVDDTKRDAIDQFWPHHAAEMTELAQSFPQRGSGPTLVHADLRDDNMIIEAGTGRSWICDWNFPLLGAPFIDLVTLLISMYGDGTDTDAVLAQSPCAGDASADDIDSLLADLALYYRIAAGWPPVDNSPHLRDHQGWYAQVTAAWLANRRGWR